MNVNPWVEAVVRGKADVDPAPREEAPPVLAPSAHGPQSTQRSVEPPSDRLPRQHVPHPNPRVVGLHGGSGETTIAAAIGWTPAGHAWPMCEGSTVPVVVTCRPSGRGLVAARNAAREWASSLLGGVDLLGLIVVADLPGRTHKILRRELQVVAAAYPRMWRVSWSEPLHVTGSTDLASGEFDLLRAALDALTDPEPPPT